MCKANGYGLDALGLGRDQLFANLVLVQGAHDAEDVARGPLNEEAWGFLDDGAFVLGNVLVKSLDGDPLRNLNDFVVKELWLFDT